VNELFISYFLDVRVFIVPVEIYYLIHAPYQS